MLTLISGNGRCFLQQRWKLYRCWKIVCWRLNPWQVYRKSGKCLVEGQIFSQWFVLPSFCLIIGQIFGHLFVVQFQIIQSIQIQVSKYYQAIKHLDLLLLDPCYQTQTHLSRSQIGSVGLILFSLSPHRIWLLRSTQNLCESMEQIPNSLRRTSVFWKEKKVSDTRLNIIYLYCWLSWEKILPLERCPGWSQLVLEMEEHLLALEVVCVFVCLTVFLTSCLYVCLLAPSLWCWF